MITRDVKEKVEYWIKEGESAFLLTGARQIGKTYLIRQCLKESGIPFVELNFIEDKSLKDLFSNITNTKDLVTRLSLVSNVPLQKGKTIIFLDEVQECKEFITMVKFLVEDGSFRYILSGSLLGVELSDLRSAPVGYLEIVDMYPLNFKEFVIALGINEDVINSLKDCFKNRKSVDDFVHNKMIDLFYLYLIIGGMPEAVDVYIKTNDLKKVEEVHEKIIRLYRVDFSKYERVYKLKIREIYDSMPGQLDQKVKRFKFSSIGKSLEYDRLENSFLWLKDAGVAIPVYNINEPRVPLVISENRNLFKLFFSDVGLLTSFYPNEVKVAILNKDKDINNGALFENVVAQELLSKGFKLYYFNSKKQGELDFVIEMNGKALPLEIKSGKDYKRHSALSNVLNDSTYGIKEAYIFSSGNVEVIDKEIYMPIYMTMFLENADVETLIYKLDIEGLNR